MIDFHCHIDLFANPSQVLDEVESRGVYLLAVTTTPKAWNAAKKLVGARRRIQVGLGLHPELVPERHAEVPLFEYLLPEAKYVGEIGIDGSPHLKGSFQRQEDVLKRILRACAAGGGRIMTLHTRRAASGVLDALASEPKAGTPILHWFSGTQRELSRAIDLGCWFSVGPAMLSSAKGIKLVELMPRERILTETDAPFGTMGGKPLMPWDVVLAYPSLAEIWNCPQDKVSEQLLNNLRRLVGQLDH